MGDETTTRWGAAGYEVGRYAAAFAKPIAWGLLVGGTQLAVLPEGPSVAVIAATVVALSCVKPPRGERLLDLDDRSKLVRLVAATVAAVAATAFGVAPNAFLGGAVLHLAFKAVSSSSTRNRGLVIGVSAACVAVLLTSGDVLSWSSTFRDVVRIALLALMVQSSASDQRKETELAAARDAAVSEERARIARELHDVVAHHVSAMTIQAEAARTALPPDATRADAALSAAATEGRTAMTELRTLLGVLRGPAGAAELGPQPTLADLDDLVLELRAKGIDVRFERGVGDDVEAGLSPALRLSAFRIVQEALANVRKHAQASVVDVRVAIVGDAMIVEVEDDGRGTGSFRSRNAASSGGGYGIVGMRERAALVGGTVEAMPRTDGQGWRVRAELPLRPVSA